MVKIKLSVWVRCLFVFALSTCISLILIVHTNGPLGAADDGAFYTTLGRLIWQNGFVKDLPWLHYTNYSLHSPGIHWLYPVLISPIAGNFPGEIASILIGVMGFGIALAAFYFVTFKSNVRWPGFWTILLVFSSGDFGYRLLFARPIAASLTILLLGWLFTVRSQYKLLLPLAALYVWIYDAYILLPLVVGITAVVSEPRLNSKIKAIGFCVTGILLGLIINPYFPSNIQELHFLITPALGSGLQSSNEWQNLNLIAFSKYSHIFIALLGLVGIYLYTAFRKRQNYIAIPKLTWSLIILSVLFAGVTLKSQRFIEYAAPFLTLAAATTIQAGLRDRPIRWIKSWHTTIGIAVLLSVLIVGVYKSGAWTIANYRAGMNRTNEFQAAASSMRVNALPESVVLNSNWDQFPALFFWNQANYYVTGLDPVFLYKYNQDLYWQWRKIADDTATIDQVISIAHIFQARTIFLEPRKNPQLSNILRSSPGLVTMQYCDAYACVFKLK